MSCQPTRFALPPYSGTEYIASTVWPNSSLVKDTALPWPRIKSWRTLFADVKSPPAC